MAVVDSRACPPVEAGGRTDARSLRSAASHAGGREPRFVVAGWRVRSAGHAGLLEQAGDWTRRSLLARYDSLYNFERRARRTMQQACRAVGWRRCPKDT